MKISKAEAVICLLAAMFLSFSAGWFFRGERSAQPLQVETQYTPAVTVSASPTPTQTPAAGETSVKSAKSAPEGKVDLNTASEEVLQTLPGIGEKRAADIVADREANGPFSSPEDLTRVKGIGEATFQKLRNYITVSEEGNS